MILLLHFCAMLGGFWSNSSAFFFLFFASAGHLAQIRATATCPSHVNWSSWCHQQGEPATPQQYFASFLYIYKTGRTLITESNAVVSCCLLLGYLLLGLSVVFPYSNICWNRPAYRAVGVLVLIHCCLCEHSQPTSLSRGRSRSELGWKNNKLLRSIQCL